MNGFDLLKHVTERFTSYLHVPPESKSEDQAPSDQPVYVTNRWFGMIPFAIKLFIKKTKSRK